MVTNIKFILDFTLGSQRSPDTINHQPLWCEEICGFLRSVARDSGSPAIFENEGILKVRDRASLRRKPVFYSLLVLNNLNDTPLCITIKIRYNGKWRTHNKPRCCVLTPWHRVLCQTNTKASTNILTPSAGRKYLPPKLHKPTIQIFTAIAIHYVLSLTTAPQPLPKWLLYTERSSASSSIFQ